MTQWNAELYDNKHGFVSNFGGSLIEVLAPKPGERILDVGCGTGDLANDISRFGASVVGIDAADSMIEKAREKYPHCTFLLADGESFGPFISPFNAIFSNAAIHWMKDQRRVVQNCYEALRPGGRFVAELGGARNIQSIVKAIQEASKKLNIPYKHQQFPWVFPTPEEMTHHLESVGFHVAAMDYYERPTPLVGEDGLRNWLDMFSTSLLAHLSEKEKADLYTECENMLRPVLYQNGTWVADYWRLRFVAVK